MGWQGRLRGIRGERFFEMLPTVIRQRMKFVSAHSWRDDTHVWLLVKDQQTGKEGTIRIRRENGGIEQITKRWWEE